MTEENIFVLIIAFSMICFGIIVLLSYEYHMEAKRAKERIKQKHQREKEEAKKDFIHISGQHKKEIDNIVTNLWVNLGQPPKNKP